MSLFPSSPLFSAKSMISDADTAAATALAKSERRNRWRPYFLGPLRVRRAGEREALILTLVCALDMYTTLWWVITGRATESNENLAWTFQHHPVLFVLVKCGSCLPALLLAPHLARRHPKFTTWLLRGIIFTYIAYYLMNIR